MANSRTAASLSNAIANVEGYGVNPTNRPTRTNNPGDIGNTATGSKAYGSQADGYAALNDQVSKMLDGDSKYYNPNMTLDQVGYVYAHPGAAWGSQVAAILGVPSTTTLGQIASGEVLVKDVPQPQGDGTNRTAYSTSSAVSTPGGSSGVDALTVNDSDPAVAQPVSGASIPEGQLGAINAAIDPPLIIDNGLSNTPWYSDNSIVQVNNSTNRFDPDGQPIGYPVKFQIYFQKMGSPLPVVINLLASLRTHEKELKHVVTKQPTRTGVLVNLWGMVPDSISGTATTGLMMNQYGVTDFLSLSTATDEAKALVQAAYAKDNNTANITAAEMNAPGIFRVAARDAFGEFLAMFKNNGVVWFRNEGYTGVTTSLDQTAANAWSPKTGSTTFQNASRRNDVMTRGRVVMHFRNVAYSGYFQSLSWTMDAKKPFSWDFNFTFQVESTAISVEVPNL